MLLFELIIPIAIIWLVYRLFKFRWKGQSILSYFNSKSVLYITLLGWIILGWVSEWDTTQQYGCLSIPVSPEQKIRNFLFTCMALLLVVLAYFTSSRRIAFTLLSLELGIWLFKLLFVKGGYITGIAGSVDPAVLIYDSISLILRLLFLRAVTRMLVYPRTILVFSIILILLKLWLFRGI